MQCTDHNPEKRPSFKELHRLFVSFSLYVCVCVYVCVLCVRIHTLTGSCHGGH